MPTPLAYVFWHWPKAEVSRDSYEAKMASFLRGLSSNKAAGLVEVMSFRVDPLPWTPQSGSVYEDWYVVEDFSALGALNDAAVATEARGLTTRSPRTT
jgi:hypothetical protein